MLKDYDILSNSTFFMDRASISKLTPNYSEYQLLSSSNLVSKMVTVFAQNNKNNIKFKKSVNHLEFPRKNNFTATYDETVEHLSNIRFLAL